MTTQKKLELSPVEQLALNRPQKSHTKANVPVKWVCELCYNRQRLGLTIAAVAKATGLNPSTIWEAEQGQEVRLMTAWKLAKFYGLDIADLWEPIPEEHLHDREAGAGGLSPDQERQRDNGVVSPPTS